MGLSCLSHRDLACLQTALRNVIEPIFERDFAPQSYGFRPGRGCKDALRRVDQLLKLKKGRVWVVDVSMPAGDPSISVRSTHQLESRMRYVAFPLMWRWIRNPRPKRAELRWSAT
jgi:hypothetical protein